jgi:hypothetical protein
MPVEWIYDGATLLASIYESAGAVSAIRADGCCLGRFDSRTAARRAVFLATRSDGASDTVGTIAAGEGRAGP